MSKERKIITEYDPKPIPVRRFDWVAFYEGQEERGCGYGLTEAEAIEDLEWSVSDE